jgi:hypothetical protein
MNVTSEDLRSELEKQPFIPLRMHLVSGKTLDIAAHDAAWMLQNSVLIFHVPHSKESGYDVVALRNIERLEQVRLG